MKPGQTLSVVPIVPGMNPSWATLLDKFDTYQRAANRSPGTRRLYRYRLLSLAKIVDKPAEVTYDVLLTIQSRADWAPDTAKSVRTAYRTFFAWADRFGHLDGNPAQHLPTVRVPDGLPRPTPEKIMRRTILTTNEKRVRFMLMLAGYGGLRCCEIASLRGEWWDGRTLRVVGKGSKTRLVPIRHGELVALLDLQPDGPVFPNHWTGQPITPGYVCKLLGEALPDGWTAHTLRHRFGTVTLEKTKDVFAVADIMGHASANTTRRYGKVSAKRLNKVAKAAAA